ncbi:MAG TPA: PaaI family thioesterase [Candidatus Limnocylindria bacterium]|nr:PaaI family thioesterase [Candidatus Limnocylindria bacterium]
MARLSELGINFAHHCFACGRLNEAGLHLDFDVSRDRAETRFTPERRHEGYDGTVHGGIVTALLDETMGWAIFHQGIWAVTTRLSVSFRRPVTVGEELRVVGEVTRRRSRAIETRGTVSRVSSGDVLAEAEATFLVMSEDQRRELQRRYSIDDEVFARVREAVEREHATDREREYLRT